jgi:shikimate kinase
MPGCGKSTIGVLLAKRLGFGFIDTDLLIQQSSRHTLQQLIDQQGYVALRELEEKVLLSLSPVQQVIATGGSAVYSKAGIAHLGQIGQRVYLQDDLKTLKDRVGDFSKRGIASDKDQSFDDIFWERSPLYEQVADLTVDCQGLTTEQIVEEIVRRSTP